MRSGAGSGPGCTGWWRARAGGGSGLLHTVQYSTVQYRSGGGSGPLHTVLLLSAAVTECHTVAPGASNAEDQQDDVPHPPS